MPERIQKLLAAAGMGSRRGIEEWLRSGRLTVNGTTAKLGDRAEPGDAFALDGRPLQVAVEPDYKPAPQPIPGPHAGIAGSALALDRTDLDLYGERVAIELVARLRPTVRFDGVDALLVQMADDVKRCHEVLGLA